MSFHVSRTEELAMRALRRSLGSPCTAPTGTLGPLTLSRDQVRELQCLCSVSLVGATRRADCGESMISSPTTTEVHLR